MSGEANMPPHKPLMVQCDFDGTVTIGDLSFQILDKYTDVPWRQWFDDFRHGILTVNDYNSRAFSYVKASRQELDQFSRDNVTLRPGIKELINTCHENKIRFCFVSNGMAFYIEAIIDMLHLSNIEYVAAHCDFLPDGIRAVYYDPSGEVIRDNFKVSYTVRFLEEGYRIVYIGNGLSDFKAASMCDYVYGIDSLAEECQKHAVPFTSFTSLEDIAKDLPRLV